MFFRVHRVLEVRGFIGFRVCLGRAMAWEVENWGA